MEGSGLQCCKYVMFIFNFIIFLGGLALVGFGAWAYVNAGTFGAIISSSPAILNAFAVIIAVGCILVVAGFLGCGGAIRESRCLLGAYFTIVLLLFIAEVVAVILIFVYYPKAEQLAMASIASYNTTTQLPWDVLQSTLNCCGYKNVSDWGANLPDSCCGVPANCSITSPTLYTEGCEQAFVIYFWYIGGAGIAVLVIEILSMIFSCCLYHGVGKYEIA